MQAASAPTKKLNGHESRCREPDSGSPMPAYECPPQAARASQRMTSSGVMPAVRPYRVECRRQHSTFVSSIPSPSTAQAARARERGKGIGRPGGSHGRVCRPARQPWRGVGNLNITRFYRASAIKTVNEWSSALDRLLQGVRILRAATQWEGTQNLEVARRACQLVRLLPLLDMPID
jgi:hypothetical protein